MIALDVIGYRTIFPWRVNLLFRAQHHEHGDEGCRILGEWEIPFSATFKSFEDAISAATEEGRRIGTDLSKAYKGTEVIASGYLYDRVRLSKRFPPKV